MSASTPCRCFVQTVCAAWVSLLGCEIVQFRSGNIPDELIRAHRTGDLILFVGAGASVPDPSSCQTFRELAETIGGACGDSTFASDKEAPEDYLERLEAQGINVHGAVHDRITRSDAHNDTHQAIAALASTTDKVRIVTTNYDSHLTAALESAPKIYEYPDVPGGDDIDGVVHLHGSVRQEPKRLVITKTDFAKAYMEPLSPRLAFLHRILSSKTILFVGYGVNDTLMQYILRARPMHAELYALTSQSTNDSVLQDSGVHPVHHGTYDDLPKLLYEWAEFTGASGADHEKKVLSVSTISRGGKLSPLDDAYFQFMASEPELVRYFTLHARGAGWFRWVAEGPGSRLFRGSARQGEDNPCDEALAEWFVRSFNDDDETAIEMTRLLVEHVDTFDPFLWANILDKIDFQGRMSNKVADRIAIALIHASPPKLGSAYDDARVFLRKLGASYEDMGDEVLLVLVDKLCEPRLSPAKAVPLELGIQSLPFTTKCVNPSEDSRRRAPHPLYWTQRRHLVPQLMGIIEGHLHRVAVLFTAADEHDPYSPHGDRVAIERHEQNTYHGSRTFLVDAVRDLYDALVQDEPPRRLWLFVLVGCVKVFYLQEVGDLRMDGS